MQLASPFILLIPLTLALIFLQRLGSNADGKSPLASWQGDFLVSLSIWGALIVVITEGLSLFSWINWLGLVLAWSLAASIAFTLGLRDDCIARGWRRLLTGMKIENRLEWVLLSVMAIFIAVLFVIGVAAPSNNVDALQYHLPRALHWLQNGSLRHYPTARIAQDIRPYWAEVAILHLRGLWGNDRPVNLVQWLSMIASIIAVTGIAKLLGREKQRTWLTAIFALTIPMGVLQASTAQNDYAATLWVVALAYFVVLSRVRRLQRLELIAFALAIATGMLTKGTFFPFAAPLVIWFFLGRLREAGLRRVFIEATLVSGIVAALNGGFWLRNIRSYGSPYGNQIPVGILSDLPGSATPTVDRINKVSTKPESSVTTSGLPVLNSRNPISASDNSLMQDQDGIIRLRDWPTTVIQMIAMNFVTPVRSINLSYFRILSRISGPFTPQYIGSLEAIAWNQENLAGSPLHILAVLMSTISCWVLGRKKENRLLVGYGASAFVGFSLLAFIGHVTVVYSIRYQLAYLVMGAPLVGIVVGRIRKGWIRNVTMLGLLIYTLPYLLISNMRPLIGMPPWPTRVGSIFTTEPAEILFALNPGNLDEYQRVTGLIEGANCMKVGLWLYHEDLEYTFWWLLNAPQSGVELRFIRTEPALERYLDPNYSPCAIICTQCQGMESVDGIPLKVDYGQIQLFLLRQP